MDELDAGPDSWDEGTLAAEFAAMWRAGGTASGDQIEPFEAEGTVQDALDRLVDHLPDHYCPTVRHRKRLENLVGAVKGAVIGTLGAVALHSAASGDTADVRGWRNPLAGHRKSAQPEPVVLVSRSKLGWSISNALDQIERASELLDPPRQYSIAESGTLLDLLQELLGAEVRKKADKALEAAHLIRLYLKKSGVDVVDRPLPGASETSPFVFENEDERSRGGGTVVLPALVDRTSRGVLKLGHVMADPDFTPKEQH
jgi:hypothetical protein